MPATILAPMLHGSFRGLFALSLLALALTLVWALASGQFSIAFTDALHIIWHALTGNSRANESTAQSVLLEIRGPRIVAAFAVGAALASAGAAFQNLFRNPLVSPDILGVSSGAALGALLALFLALPLVFVQGFAFLAGLGAVVIVIFLASRIDGRGSHHDRTLVLVLLGVVVGSLFGAGIALSKYAADPFQQLPAMTYWLLGSFSGVTAHDLAFALPIMVFAFVPLFLLRWRINLLALDDDEARGLGINVPRTRLIVIAAATLMTAAAVALCGMIGWVGLVIPHAVRLLIGAEFSRLLPLTAVLGGTFMLLVDTIGRAFTQTEIPPGVVTALIGAPVFIALLLSTFSARK
jgi:iron complex transport system permease protein